MADPFIDETGRDISDIRPETLPGAKDSLELLDAADPTPWLGGRPVKPVFRRRV